MPAPAQPPVRRLWYVGHRHFSVVFLLPPLKSRGNPHVDPAHHPRFPQHFSQWSQWNQPSATACPKECAMVRAVDASTVNRPRASDAAPPIPDVTGRGRFAWRPLLVDTDGRPNIHLRPECSTLRARKHRNFILTFASNIPSEVAPPTPIHGGCVPRHLPSLGQGQSRLVQPWPRQSAPWVTVQPRAVAHSVARFVALSSGENPATKRSIASPSTTCTHFTLQQPLGDPTVKMTAPVATSPSPSKRARYHEAPPTFSQPLPSRTATARQFVAQCPPADACSTPVPPFVPPTVPAAVSRLGPASIHVRSHAANGTIASGARRHGPNKCLFQATREAGDLSGQTPQMEDPKLEANRRRPFHPHPSPR
jgi:hypothetical protein